MTHEELVAFINASNTLLRTLYKGRASDPLLQAVQTSRNAAITALDSLPPDGFDIVEVTGARWSAILQAQIEKGTTKIMRKPG